MTSFNEKLAILSLVPFKSHSKSDIMRIFKCSRHIVDKAGKSGLKVISDFDDATINVCYETPNNDWIEYVVMKSRCVLNRIV